MNREEWLGELAQRLNPLFKSAGHDLPTKLRVSVGFPSHGALSEKKRVIGQCFYSEASADKTIEIFVTPLIGDGLRAADVLVHELCHAVLPFGVKHGPKFWKLAQRLGLEGKPTATIAGTRLVETLQALSLDLGPYPHAELMPLIVPKTQTTRMKKVACPECGYVVRITKKWIDVGLPICCCGSQMASEDAEEGDGDRP